MAYIRWVLDQSDSSLIGQEELNQISSAHLQNIVNILSGNVNSPQNLAQLNPHFASIMQLIPYPRVRKIFRSETSDIVEEFRQLITSLEARLSSKVDELNDQLSDTEVEIEKSAKSVQALSKDIVGIQTQLQSQMEVWENQNKAEISERLNELNSAFEESQQRWRDENEKQADRISNMLNNVRSEAEKTQETTRSLMDTVRSNLVDWRKEEQSNANETLVKIKNIYEIVGQTTLAGDFERAAKEESTSARWFSSAATLFFIIAPLFFAYQWSSLDLTKQDYVGILSKITGSAVFLIPAAYFASTAQRHRRVATALRSLGVRVATFDAYLANFEDEERNKLKAEMASVFFDASISPDRIRHASKKEMAESLDVFSNVLERLEGLVKRNTSGGN